MRTKPKMTGLQKEKKPCRHNSMSHCFAVLHLHPPVLQTCWVHCVCSLCKHRQSFDRHTGFSIKHKIQSTGMLKVNHLVLPLFTPATRGSCCANCQFTCTADILHSPHTYTNSHWVVVTLLFRFKESHGEESACLQTQHQYDSSNETGHVKSGLGEIWG